MNLAPMPAGMFAIVAGAAIFVQIVLPVVTLVLVSLCFRELRALKKRFPG